MSLPFDELNVLALQRKQRSIPIDQFFDEMDLPASEKEDRKEFSKRMQDILFFTLSLLHILLVRKIDWISLDSIKADLAKKITDLLEQYTYPDLALQNRIEEYASGFVDATANHSISEKSEDLAYWYSEDRARFNAEDETNDLFNYEQFRDAIRNGAKYKQWITMRDERVRRTHAEVDGMIVGINDFFPVGDCQMRFAHDTEYGDPEELIGCRCTTRYLTEEEFKAISRAA